MPTLIWVSVTPESTPVVVTATGTKLFVVELFPSSPLLLSPQQYARPVLPSAQARSLPTLIWVSVTPESTPAVDTATGTLLLVTVLFPSCPSEFLPQQ